MSVEKVSTKDEVESSLRMKLLASGFSPEQVSGAKRYLGFKCPGCNDKPPSLSNLSVAFNKKRNLLGFYRVCEACSDRIEAQETPFIFELQNFIDAWLIGSDS